MSSFRRIGRGGKSSAVSARNTKQLISLAGVKPWTGGIELTSVGLSELDNVLGGGQPLATVMFMEEDRWTPDLSLSLLKYWCAEAISQNQKLIFPVIEEACPSSFTPSTESSIIRNAVVCNGITSLLMSLPRNLHWAKSQTKQNMNASRIDISAELGVLEESDQGNDTEEGLEIAWQYKKSVQEEMLAQPGAQKWNRSSSTTVFCHSYDLSARLSDQKPLNPADYMIGIMGSKGERLVHPGILLFRELVSLLKGREGVATRMVLYNTNPDLMSVALPLFLSHIRKNQVPVVLFLYFQPSKRYKALSRLSGMCDVILQSEGFSARNIYPPPPEFRLLHGVLTVSKISTVTAATAGGGGFCADISASKRPAAFVYGFKRDRRKLHISLLHIPPEEYAQGGGSAESGVRSVAGKATEKNISETVGCRPTTSRLSAFDF